MPKLVVYSSGIANQTIELTGQNVRIGRAKGNDVVLLDPAQVVSRFHAELRYEEGHYILLDLNSANGTWVWDHRIHRIVLDAGTVAEIGDYRLVLEAEPDATTVPPSVPLSLGARGSGGLKAATGTVIVSPMPPSQSSPPPASSAPDRARPTAAWGSARDALERARTFDAMGRVEDAIAQYERAVQLLAPDDPNRMAAKERLGVLKISSIRSPSR